MKANEIINVLNSLRDSSYQRVLINGRWGIGKTKYILDFKEEYSNVCYVSLFGKKDIDSIIQEIYIRIIENTPKGTIKKNTSLLREKLESINVGFLGVSISIPIIEELQKTLHKELSQTDTYIIIFDDLERKHSNLGVEEVLGLLDSLSGIENIKTVLVAATDQLKDEDKKEFKNYKEKAIDRPYIINDYADEAPINILGEQIWNVIGKLAENFEFKNLRTFEKTNLFIQEVVQVLGEDVFTDKFTKDDVYRMCFATVFFKIEHKGEMKLLDTENNKRALMADYYTKEKSGKVEYLTSYILKNSLDNIKSKDVFHYIKVWYETGTSHKENLLKVINSINIYEEKPHNFYSSEQEILEVIDYSRNFIRNIKGTERIEDIVSNLTTAFIWCEILSVGFGISNEKIIEMIKKNILKSIDIEKNIFENQLDLRNVSIESDKAKKLVHSINRAIDKTYYNQLLKGIENNFTEGSYSNYSYIRRFTDEIHSIETKENRATILNSIEENSFYFPIPSGKITESQWNWCHLIVKLIANINQYWEIENYYDDFISTIYELDITKKDKMLQHRLKHLF